MARSHSIRDGNFFATRLAKRVIIAILLLSASLVLPAIYVRLPADTAANAQQPAAEETTTIPSSLWTIPPDLISSIINSGNPPSSENFNISDSFKIEPLLWNMSFPSSVAFDEAGNNMYVAESGLAFGGVREIPRILQVDMVNETISVVADRFLSAPITDITYHNGSLFVSNHGKISKVDPKTGLVEDLISGFPVGDHPLDQITFGPDGRMYFAMGSATNSGVVGVDNYLPSLGWLASFPMTHDVPAKNATLSGQNFETPNVMADGKKIFNATTDMNKIQISIVPQNSNGTFGGGKGTAAVMSNNTGNVITGAFMAFGNSTQSGQEVKGKVKCTGCILSANPDGTDLELVAWGLRLDIFSGITFDKNGSSLIVSDSGSEERGSRPIRGDHDKIWKIDVFADAQMGKWYGWPDHALGNGSKKLQPVTEPQFQSPRGTKPLERLTQGLTPASDVFANPGYAVKMTKAALAPDRGNLGLSGLVLLGEYGTHAPTTHDFGSQDNNIVQYVDGKSNNGTKILGQKIVMLNTTTGNMTDLVSLKKPDPSFRPVGMAFSPDGNSLYIVSLGKTEHRTTLPNGAPLSVPQIWPYTDTGVIWRVSKPDPGEATGIPNSFTLASELTAGVNIGAPPEADTIELQEGYKIEPVLWNLDLPGATTFDDNGNMYIAEVGFAYNGLTPQPRILKVDRQAGNVSVFVDRGFDWPLSYITFHDGQLYVSNGGRISTVDMQGRISNIIQALPGIGDHYVDQITFAPDSRMYFGIGTATNSDIVGRDNPWVKAIPNFHDIPGKNITLAGINFPTENFFTAEKNDSSVTGAYVPFGTATTKDQLIKGDTKCTGCILSANPDGTDLKLVAWGMRHPYGLGFTSNGKLVVTMNAVDERGSRNIANDGDKIYIIDISNSSSFGEFYGWPDFYGNGEPVTEDKFKSPRNPQNLSMLIQNPPPVIKPARLFDTGAALTHIEFSNSSTGFGFGGKGFIGEFGTLAPQTHLTAEPESRAPSTIMGEVIGQKVITFDPNTLEVGTFMSLNSADLSFRPVDVEFSPDGDELYVLSIAKYEVRTVTPTGGILPFQFGQPWPYPYTGILWKVTPSEGDSGTDNQQSSTGNTTTIATTAATTVTPSLIIGSSGNTSIIPSANATEVEEAPETNNVAINIGAALQGNQAFQPNPVVVKANGTINWINNDNVVHTVTSGLGFSSPDRGKEFDSGMLGGMYSHRFNATGTFDYFCQIHPSMKGTVVVK
ncbi:MAG: plastocyanin/azurin family copper-binding protein [Thermoproteota archaeon]|nr:plastocyanin/azurin family copper-binding protein [Thermoproteota archaeon]